MEGIVALFTSAPGAKTKGDDDVVDRLSNKYTVIIVVMFAVVVGSGLLVGTPIICWAPQHFTGAHSSYANAYCWVRNTYFLDFNSEIPAAHEHNKRQELPYYQWIPFILLAQALGFFLPSAVWHAYNQSAGIDADTILDMANTFNNTEAVKTRENTLMIIGNQMDRFLTHRIKFSIIEKSKKKELKGAGMKEKIRKKKLASSGFGCYLVVLYIITKVLYLANVIAQLFILNSILAVEYSLYGWEVMTWMISDEDGWSSSPQVAFPRVTMCDFNIRRLGNVHRYTVQCTLPINLYNEKIYMFLWFWMVFVAIVTAVSLVTWIMRFVVRSDRIKYVQNHLKMMEKIDSKEDRLKAEDFAKSYLRHDGVFLLRLIGHNTNTLTVSEIIATLWDNWKGKDMNGNPTAPSDFELEPTTDEAPMLPEKQGMP